MASNAQFRHEHIAVTPRGYRVRTVVRDGHRVRIAFPPGRRVLGAGKLVEVLHPPHENPCVLPNPAELLVMSANPGRGWRPYFVLRSGGEKYGRIVATQKMAWAQVARILADPSVEFTSNLETYGVERMSKNPRRYPNPSGEASAAQLHEEFHGAPPTRVTEHQEPAPRVGTLTELGTLLEIRLKRPTGWKWGELDFKGAGVKLASTPDGRQLYCIGGEQKISRGMLTQLGADNSKDLIDLGEAMYIAYRTRKSIAAGAMASYEHNFGEETGVRPQLMYDRRGSEPRIYFVGGEYRVEAPGIIN